MASSEIPNVAETDLDRDDLVEAAEELGIEGHDSLDDQQLFEELGRRLGEVDDGDEEGAASTNGERSAAAAAGETSDDAEGRADDAAQDSPERDAPQEAGDEAPRDLTRDELRDELRELGLPVSGSKDELIERVETARKAAATATSDGASRDAGTEDADVSGDAGEQADSRDADEAQATGEQAGRAEAEDAEDADAEDAAEGEDAENADESGGSEDAEYRVEDDQRDEVVPLLDVELGPLAVDLLGVEVRLNRLHPVIVLNPEPRFALLGKLLSGVAVTADKLGVSTATDTAIDGVEKLVEQLPSPSGDDGTGDQDDEGEEGDDESGGLLRRLGSKASGAVRSAGSVVGHATDALGNAKDAAVDAITPKGKLAAAREAMDAGGDIKDAVDAGTDAVSGD